MFRRLRTFPDLQVPIFDDEYDDFVVVVVRGHLSLRSNVDVAEVVVEDTSANLNSKDVGILRCNSVHDGSQRRSDEVARVVDPAAALLRRCCC